MVFHAVREEKEYNTNKKHLRVSDLGTKAQKGKGARPAGPQPEAGWDVGRKSSIATLSLNCPTQAQHGTYGQPEGWSPPLLPMPGQLPRCCGCFFCPMSTPAWSDGRAEPQVCLAGFYMCCTRVSEGWAILSASSRAVHFWVSYARQKWKNEYFMGALSYFIFQTMHLLAPINTLKLLIKIARVCTGKAIK